jgi:hypothetical protein
MLEAPAKLAWMLSTGHFGVLGKIAHDCLIGIRTVPGSIGLGEALKGVTVAKFDSVEPSLFDREAQAGMIEPNQCTNAGEVKAAWVRTLKRYLINHLLSTIFRRTIFCLSFPSWDRATAPWQCEYKRCYT